MCFGFYPSVATRQYSNRDLILLSLELCILPFGKSRFSSFSPEDILVDARADAPVHDELTVGFDEPYPFDAVAFESEDLEGAVSEFLFVKIKGGYNGSLCLCSRVTWRGRWIRSGHLNRDIVSS